MQARDSLHKQNMNMLPEFQKMVCSRSFWRQIAGYQNGVLKRVFPIPRPPHAKVANPVPRHWLIAKLFDMTLITNCPACMSSKWRALPGWPNQSMLSDGRSVAAPLEKKHCEVCGLIRHSMPPSQTEIEAIFNQDYALHARLVGNVFESQRQSLYADWIQDLLGASPIHSIFEIGAGTGSLMAELRRRAPQGRGAGGFGRLQGGHGSRYRSWTATGHRYRIAKG